MANLYDVLGVDKAADKKAIRDAYRQKAKSAHPDTGGDVKKFALVKRAHDILTDEERRRKYDATGDESEAQPDNTFGNAMQVLQVALDKVLQQCLQAKREPTEVDMIAALKESLNNDIAEAKKNRHQLEKMKKVDEKLAKRFSRKNSSKKKKREVPKFDVFENLIKGRLSAIGMRIAQLDEHVEKTEFAMELIEDYVYRKDEEPRDQMRSIGNFMYTTGF